MRLAQKSSLMALQTVNAVDLVGHDDEDTVSDAESVVRNVPLTMDLGILSNDELSPQGRIFVGGIWWDSSWAEDMDLYNNHEY